MHAAADELRIRNQVVDAGNGAQECGKWAGIHQPEVQLRGRAEPRARGGAKRVFVLADLAAPRPADVQVKLFLHQLEQPAVEKAIECQVLERLGGSHGGAQPQRIFLGKLPCIEELVQQQARATDRDRVLTHGNVRRKTRVVLMNHFGKWRGGIFR